MRLKAASFRAAVCARVSYSGALGEGKAQSSGVFVAAHRIDLTFTDRIQNTERRIQKKRLGYLGRATGWLGPLRPLLAGLSGMRSWSVGTGSPQAPREAAGGSARIRAAPPRGFPS